MADDKDLKQRQLQWVLEIIATLESKSSLDAEDRQILQKAYDLKAEITTELDAKNYKLNWNGILNILPGAAKLVEYIAELFKDN